jgi:hypothetical protein
MEPNLAPVRTRRVKSIKAAVATMSNAFAALTSPELPRKILVGAGAVATVIVTTGIAVWGIVGAWKVFMVLVSG